MHVFMIFTLSQILPIASPHLATLPTLCSSFKKHKTNQTQNVQFVFFKILGVVNLQGNTSL